MKTKNSERGSTLFVGLVMLVVLTLLVISAIRSSSTDLRIAGNMQIQEEAKTAAQDAIDELITNNNFTISDPVPRTVSVNGTNYTVTFGTLNCNSFTPVSKSDPNLPAECLGTAGTTYCYWASWDIPATVTDLRTGASVTVHQGVKSLAGLNPVLNKCLN